MGSRSPAPWQNRGPSIQGAESEAEQLGLNQCPYRMPSNIEGEGFTHYSSSWNNILSGSSKHLFIFACKYFTHMYTPCADQFSKNFGENQH